jgi:alpha-tubulin suppressor-like RCC1 family protein
MRLRLLHRLSFSIGLAGLVSASALAACVDDGSETRPGFDAPDTGPPAVLVEAGTDTGSTVDAGEERDPYDPADEPVTCAGTAPCAKQLVAGRHHFCALMSDGTVRCWGDPEYGALGAPPPKNPPDGGSGVRVVADLSTATQLSAARATTCARLGDGSVHCWGSNSDGQLGLDDVKPTWDEYEHMSPMPAAIRDPALRVDVGPHNVCAVLGPNKVSCWGQNDKAQLTRTPLAFVMGPGLATLDPLSVATTSFGGNTGFVLTTGGEVFSWGAVAGNDGWVSGRMSSITPDPVPNRVLVDHVTKLVASDSLQKDEGGPLGIATIGPIPGPPIKAHGHACVIAAGEVHCWGRSDTGALCTGLPDEELLPAHAPVMKGRKAWPQQLAVGDELTCARMTDGTVQCCGAAGLGRLGTGFKDLYSAFLEPVTSFTGHAVQIATSYRAVCALVQGGTVECWGSNVHGELGTATPDESPHPSPVKIGL